MIWLWCLAPSLLIVARYFLPLIFKYCVAYRRIRVIYFGGLVMTACQAANTLIRTTLLPIGIRYSPPETPIRNCHRLYHNQQGLSNILFITGIPFALDSTGITLSTRVACLFVRETKQFKHDYSL